MLTLSKPLLDDGHVLRIFFPDQYYAIAIPLLLLVIGIATLAILLGLVSLKTALGERKAKSG